MCSLFYIYDLEPINRTKFKLKGLMLWCVFIEIFSVKWVSVEIKKITPLFRVKKKVTQSWYSRILYYRKAIMQFVVFCDISRVYSEASSTFMEKWVICSNGYHLYLLNGTGYPNLATQRKKIESKYLLIL